MLIYQRVKREKIGFSGFSMVSGWWFFAYPSEKYELVSWDDSSQLNGQS